MSKKRELLLDITFDEIYYNGYHATSIDNILKKANASKSSMYYFFKSKKELVLTVIKEKVLFYIEKKYAPLLSIEENFIEEIMNVLRHRDDFDFNNGCKLNNLVQELSAQDKDFKNELEKIYLRFENIFEIVLNKAIEKKEISITNTKDLSIYIIASIEGCISTAKKSQKKRLYKDCISHLEKYLNTYKLN